MARNRSRKQKGGDDTVRPITDYDISVETEDDIKKLIPILKQFVMVMGSIHADWCGHCQTIKPLWEEYKQIEGRKIPMISINEKVLGKVPEFASAKLDGFPSNVLRGKDGSFATFKGHDGQQTNSIPGNRDKEIMTTLLTTDPSKLLANNSGLSGTDVDDSAVSTPKAHNLLVDSGKKVIKNKKAAAVETMNEPSPPNTRDDSTANGVGTESFKETNTKPIMGGSLFQSMLRVVRGSTRRRTSPKRRTYKKLRH